jgi:hypothetical protein
VADDFGEQRDCATDTWASLADQAAQQAGANLANFRDLRVSQYGGVRQWGPMVGGNPSRAWINGNHAEGRSAQFGHNLGEHIRLRIRLAGCTIVEYGDDHDIMGQTSGHPNALRRNASDGSTTATRRRFRPSL